MAGKYCAPWVRDDGSAIVRRPRINSSSDCFCISDDCDYTLDSNAVLARDGFL